jgi:ribosomal protein L11 methyltransferase
MATPFSDARSNSPRKAENMYLWHRYASSEWLISREAILQEKTDGGLVEIQSPNRKLLRLEFSTSSQPMVQSLRAQFGGEIDRWSRNWRRNFATAAKIKPLRIGTRLIIHSTRKDNRARRPVVYRLIIPAAGAFGTGEHPTTVMCLRLLEKISRPMPPGWSMLDAGTGSGILALAARRFGARNVVAIDNDPRAIAIAESNARLNRIDGIRFQIADAIKQKTRRRFDVIVANLFSELLIEGIPSWRPQLKNSGFFILSGILRDQEKGMSRALRANRIVVEEIRRRGKWIALCGRVAQGFRLRMI